MEVPTQYKATVELKLLGGPKGISPIRIALQPPVHIAPSFSSSKPSHSSGFHDHNLIMTKMLLLPLFLIMLQLV
ncbi:hypothetical protein Hanom_Chr11g01030761 [Helianthus anomalus]